jgi:hypothetical protein
MCTLNLLDVSLGLVVLVALKLLSRGVDED